MTKTQRRDAWKTSKDKESFIHWGAGGKIKGSAEIETQVTDDKKRRWKVKLKMQTTDWADFKIKQEVHITWQDEHIVVAKIY